jgi:hypothetical protein
VNGDKCIPVDTDGAMIDGTLGCQRVLAQGHTELSPRSASGVSVATLLSQQLMRWSTSLSGAGCATRTQSGSIYVPSSHTRASPSSHSGDPRARDMAASMPDLEEANRKVLLQRWV